MKKLFDAFFAAFSTYSTIPVPSIPWDKGALSYVFCFFPLIGAVIGAAELGWYFVAQSLGVSTIFYACVAAVIPVIISGGIHIEGFIDTCDAMMTWGDYEKKHEVLKDPRTGAFGVIYAIVYFLLLAGVFAQFYEKTGSLVLFFMSFILSRVLGAFASMTVPPSKFTGMLKTFSSNSIRQTTVVVLLIYFVICFILIFCSVSYIIIFIAVMAIVIYYLLFRSFAVRRFGGISGDLAGFYISTSELLLLLLAAFAGSTL